MKIKIDEVQKKLEQAAAKFVSEEEAKYFAKWNVDNHLKKAPRVCVLAEAISDIESWAKNPDSKEEIQVDRGASVLINYNKLGPSLRMKYIHDELEKRAREFGISIVGVNNTGGIHTLNLWTEALAHRDLISICIFNGGPEAVVPFGGTKGIFGTNPISYAVPTKDKPIIVDMATSDVPFFELRRAKDAGRKMKKGCIVDKDGLPTTDPKAAYMESGEVNMLPMGGGYKGYAVVLLVEILTGSLVRSFLSTEMSSEYVMEEHGGLMITIDIGSMVDVRKFKKSVSEMCEAIRKQKPAKGVEKVVVPGDFSYERAEKARKEGVVELEKKVVERLEKLIK